MQADNGRAGGWPVWLSGVSDAQEPLPDRVMDPKVTAREADRGCAGDDDQASHAALLATTRYPSVSGRTWD